MDKSRHNQAAQPDPETMLSNPEAFAGMVRLYYGRIFFTALSIVRDEETAQDIVQETFLRAWLKRDTVQQPAVQLLPWLGRISRNLAIQWQRQGQRRSRLLPVLSLEEIMVDPTDPTQPHPRDAAAQSEQSMQVVNAVMDLPEDLRQVVLLHYGDGLAPADIARLTGEARSTVTRRLARAHKELRAHLDAGLAQGLATLKPPRLHLERTCGIAGAVAILPAAGRAQLLRDIADTPIPPLLDGTGAGVSSAAGKAAGTGLLSGATWIKAAAAGLAIIVGLGTYAVRQDLPRKLLARSQPSPAPAQIVTITQAHPNVRTTPDPNRTYTKQHRGSGGGTAAPAPRTPAEYGPLPAANRKVEIRGRVVDPAGNAMAGATVKPAGARRSSPRVPGNVVTGADGTFHLTGMTPGDMSLQVSAPGYAPVRAAVQAPVDDITLSLQGPGARLAGHVIHADTGQPVAGTTVSLDLAYSVFPVETPLAISDADGHFVFENVGPGEYFLRAKATNLAMFAEKPGMFRKSSHGYKTYTLADGDQVDDVEVRMHAGYTVTGSVTESGTGKPLGGVTIERLDMDGAPTGAAIQTDSAGRYQLDRVAGLASNRVWLRLSKPGYIHQPEMQFGPENSPMFELSGDPVDRRDFEMDPAVLARGIVRDESGHPVSGAQIVIHDNLGSTLYKCDAAGRYEFSAPINRNLLMTVYAQGFTRQEVLLEATDQAINRDVVLRPGITAGGVVITAAGQPVEGIVVDARALPTQVTNQGSVITHGYEQRLRTTLTDENGRFALANLPRENLVLVASGSGYAPGRVALDATEGADIVDEAIIEVTGGAEIHGIVRGSDGSPVADVTVQLYDFGHYPDALYTKTNADGVFTFTSLAPRSVSLQAFHPELGEVSKQRFVPGEEQIELVFGGVGSLRDYTVFVVDGQTGDPITDYEIVATSGNGPTKQDDGTFVQRLEAGETTHYTIRADGYALLKIKSFQVPDHLSSPTFTLAMGPGVTVKGELAWPDDTTATLAGIPIRAGATYDRSDDVDTTTDAAGRFELRQVPAGKVEVYITPDPPYATIVREVDGMDGETIDLGRLTLAAGMTIQGHLRAADGSGLPGVEVEISELNMSPRKTTTYASGFYRFDGLGRRDYWMKIPVHGLSANLRLDDNRLTPVVTQDFHLGTATVRGRVLHNGGPVGNASISLIHDDDSRRETKSGSGGQFSLEKVMAGEYLLVANGLSNNSGQTVVRVADGATTTVDVNLDSGRVRLRVVDAAGNPVAGLGVSLTNQHAEPRLRKSYGFVSNFDGSFGVPSGRYAAVAQDFDGRVVTSVYHTVVPPNGVSDLLELRVTDASGRIVSVTRRADGSPRQDVKTQITVVEAGAFHQFDQERGTDGILTIDDLPPGRYKVWLSAEGAKSVAHEVEVTDGGEVRLEDVLD